MRPSRDYDPGTKPIEKVTRWVKAGPVMGKSSVNWDLVPVSVPRLRFLEEKDKFMGSSSSPSEAEKQQMRLENRIERLEAKLAGELAVLDLSVTVKKQIENIAEAIAELTTKLVCLEEEVKGQYELLMLMSECLKILEKEALKEKELKK